MNTKWGNITFLIGLAWLVWGACYLDYPDWDIGLSLLMGVSTYLTAGWSVSTIRARKYAQWPLAAFYAWWCVDGSYWLYWSLVKPSVMIREGQWMFSLCLFLLCGIIWTTDLRGIVASLRQSLGSRV